MDKVLYKINKKTKIVSVNILGVNETIHDGTNTLLTRDVTLFIDTDKMEVIKTLHGQ